MKTIYDVSMKHAQNLNLIPTLHLHKKAKKTVDTRCSRIMLSWAFQPKPEPNILTGNLNLRMVQLLQRSTAFLDSNLMNSTWGMVIFLLILCPTPPKMKQHVYLHNTKKHTHPPETNSEFSPQNQWLESETSFLGWQILKGLVTWSEGTWFQSVLNHFRAQLFNPLPVRLWRHRRDESTHPVKDLKVRMSTSEGYFQWTALEQWAGDY